MLGHVTAGDDSVLVETILCSQVLDNVSMATKHQNPLVLVLFDEPFEGSMGLDELVLLDLHRESLANALSMARLGQTTAIGKEDKGNGVCLKCLQGLLCATDGYSTSKKDSINVKGKGKIMGDVLKAGDRAWLGLLVL